MNKKQIFAEIDNIYKSNIDKLEKSLNYNDAERREALLRQKERYVELRDDLNENFDSLNRKSYSILELCEKLESEEILKNINHIYNYVVTTSDEYIFNETKELLSIKPELKDIIFEAYKDTIFKSELGINENFLDKLKQLFIEGEIIKNDDNKEDIENLSNVQSIELKEHYVYELIDSRNNEVFYVGKGSGRRVEQHQKDAENDNSTNKLNRINDIKHNGQEIIEKVVGRYDTEKEAFAVEATLIHYVYGIKNLTNVQPGHGADTIREKDDYSEKEGIDIPKKLYLNDGSYTIKQLDDRNKNLIIPFMNDLKCELESKTGYKFSDIDIKQSRFTRIYLDIGDFKINIGTTNSATKKVFFEVTHKDTDKIVELSNETKFEIKNHGEWCKLNLQATSDMDLILKYLELYKSILENYLGN